MQTICGWEVGIRAVGMREINVVAVGRAGIEDRELRGQHTEPAVEPGSLGFQRGPLAERVCYAGTRGPAPLTPRQVGELAV
jgi:hypothetical protein